MFIAASVHCHLVTRCHEALNGRNEESKGVLRDRVKKRPEAAFCGSTVSCFAEVSEQRGVDRQTPSSGMSMALVEAQCSSTAKGH